MADSIPEALRPSTAAEIAATPAPEDFVGQAHTTLDAGAVPVFDHANNAVVHVAHDDLPAYIQNPQYSLPKDSTLNFIDPDGKAVKIAAGEAANALNQGYELESLQARHDRRLQAEYGGAGNATLAGLAGAARGASFGISDQILTRSNLVAPETLAGIDEANPVSSTLGNIGGIVAVTAGSGGTSLLARGLGVAGRGVEGAAAVGRGVENMLTKQALKAGLSNKVAASVVTKILPRVAGSAVEGAFYGAGALLSEDALGKADLNAESLAMHAGMGALMGGALGGAFKTVGELAPVGKAVGKMVGSVASEYTDRSAAVLDLLGFTPARAAKLKAKTPQIADGLVDFVKNDLKVTLTDGASSVEAKVIATKDAAGKTIGNVIKEADDAVIATGTKPIQAKDIFQDVAVKVEQEFAQAPGAVRSAEQAAFEKELQPLIDGAIEAAGRGGEVKLSEILKFRQAADAAGYSAIGMPIETTAGKVARFTRRIYDDLLKQKLDEVAQKVGKPELAQTFSEANRLYTYSSKVLPNISSKAAKNGAFISPAAIGAATVGAVTGGVLGGAIAGVGNAVLKSHLVNNFVALGKIEAARQTSEKLMRITVDSFVKAAPVASAATKATFPLIINSALARSYSEKGSSKPKTQEDAYRNVVENVKQYSASPTAFLKNANRQTAGMFGAAPQTSSQLDTLSFQGMEYLAKKLPNQAINPAFLDAFKSTPIPSSQTIAQFNRILAAVENPANILHGLAAGTASKDEMDVLKNVYPASFKALQEMFLNALPATKGKMSYNKRVQLSNLLGVPADRSMQPQNIAGLQQMFNAPKDNQLGGGDNTAIESTAGGTQKLDKAGRVSTSNEDIVSEGAGA